MARQRAKMQNATDEVQRYYLTLGFDAMKTPKHEQKLKEWRPPNRGVRLCGIALFSPVFLSNRQEALTERFEASLAYLAVWSLSLLSLSFCVLSYAFCVLCAPLPCGAPVDVAVYR